MFMADDSKEKENDEEDVFREENDSFRFSTIMGDKILEMDKSISAAEGAIETPGGCNTPGWVPEDGGQETPGGEYGSD